MAIRFSQIDLKNIKGVLIDIDNTLYSYNAAHQKAIEYCYNLFKDSYGDELSFEAFNKNYREKRTAVTKRLLPQGACRSRLFAFQALFEEMDISQPYNDALRFEEAYWDSLIQNMALAQDAFNFLIECQAKGIKVCALSDMQAHFQIRKLQKLGFDKLINTLVTSEEVGAEKPAALMFETGLQKLELPPQDVIMVGDSQEKDIDGASQLNIKGYLVEVIDA